MPAASILIKPASANCNMDCKYCFFIYVADWLVVGLILILAAGIVVPPCV